VRRNCIFETAITNFVYGSGDFLINFHTSLAHHVYLSTCWEKLKKKKKKKKEEEIEELGDLTCCKGAIDDKGFEAFLPQFPEHLSLNEIHARTGSALKFRSSASQFFTQI